ncbi:MAG: DsbA family protein, partial [Phycisphaerales bacterium]|nr:DsbA family protein [Phycisphaerales bacterium]
RGTAFVLRAYQGRWSEGRDLGDPAVIGNIAEEVAVDPQAAITAMDDPAVHQQLQSIRAQYAQDEIVGVPFFVYEGQRFWGQDRLDALIKHIHRVHQTEQK